MLEVYDAIHGWKDDFNQIDFEKFTNLFHVTIPNPINSEGRTIQNTKEIFMEWFDLLKAKNSLD